MNCHEGDIPKVWDCWWLAGAREKIGHGDCRYDCDPGMVGPVVLPSLGLGTEAVDAVADGVAFHHRAVETGFFVCAVDGADQVQFVTLTHVFFYPLWSNGGHQQDASEDESSSLI